MNIRKFLLLIAVFTSLHATAQWTARAPFPGIARAKSTSFTVGDKIYLLGGVTASSLILSDFWEYDITANTWTQKPDFPGQERYGAVSFVINDTAYISCGGNNNTYHDDMWQYVPATGFWYQRQGMPVGQPQHENQRVEPFGFTIDGKIYLGGGSGWVFMPNQTVNYAFHDLWEYNPAANSWTPKTSIPDAVGRNMSIAAAINGKGYVGLGCNVDQTINYHSFWEYDPATDSWAAKAPFTPNFTTDAGTYVLNNELYLLGGVNLNPVSLSSQFYKYNPLTDSWTALSSFNGGSIAGQFTLSTGTRVFTGTGYNAAINPRNDVWELVTTGIEETAFDNIDGITLYPNPAKQFINISSTKEIAWIEIHDALGNVVVSEKNTHKPVSIGNLNAALYNLKVTLSDGNVSFNRFIKAE